MFTLFRSLVYASLFVAFLLVLLPARLLTWAGVHRPGTTGVVQVAGVVVLLAGGGLAVACVLAFALVGRGTPAPFDPPRRLVVSGPYRWVRNPMYAGAVTALLGAALFFESAALAGYAVLFGVIAHAFVRLYEEPILARMFGPAYEAYREGVPRWLPRRSDHGR